MVHLHHHMEGATVAVNYRDPVRAAFVCGDSESDIKQTIPQKVCDEELHQTRAQSSPIRCTEDTVHDRRMP